MSRLHNKRRLFDHLTKTNIKNDPNLSFVIDIDEIDFDENEFRSLQR